MKKIMIVASLMSVVALAACAQSKTNYVDMTSKISLTRIGEYVNQKNYRLVYDANIAADTNYPQCSVIAYFAYTNNWDTSLAFDFLENHLPKLHTNEYAYICKLNGLDPNRAISFYKTKCQNNEERFKVFALYMHNGALAKLSSENLEFVKSIITKEYYESLGTSDESIGVKLMIVAISSQIDSLENVAENGIFDGIYDEDDIIVLMKKGYICGGGFAKSKYRYRIMNLGVRYAKSIEMSIRIAKLLDRKYETNENITWVLKNRSSEISFADKVSILDTVGTNDEKIDLFLGIDENQSPKTIEWFIKFVNALDVEYRQKDVLKILKNINAKYTLKLYDQRDAWEPVLSKVRAMIDVR